MLPFQTLIELNKQAGTPVYQQIANRLVNLIQEGIIKPGSDLPGTREMSNILRVHRKTVVAAYDELNAQDWIQAFPRKGVRVSQHLPVIKPRTFRPGGRVPAYAGNSNFVFSKMPVSPGRLLQGIKHRLIINDGFPDARLAPVDLLLREYRHLFNRYGSKQGMSFTEPAGSLNLRAALAHFLSETRGLNIGTNNVFISGGAQMAIYIAARLILRPGANVLVGDSNYFLADMIFQQFGANLIRVPVDENGMDVVTIERICKKKKADLLYIIPHHHHPTTVTLSSDRRMKLIEIIRKYKLPVIEDDYDYDFHYSSAPILPLASADHGGNVIYIGSLTKILVSSTRMGYMIAPANFVQEAGRARRLIDLRGDVLLEEAMASLFTNGDIGRHLKKSVKIYHQRRDLLCSLLDEKLAGVVKFKRPDGGMAVWVLFNKKYPLPSISNRASAKGLLMSDGSNYSYGTINQNAFRMGFASLNEKEMTEIVQLIANIVSRN
jgi:GntR family transcriptional regulator / MocR family aminotransferase